MSSQLPSMNPTGYVGVRPLNPGNITFHNRDPNNLQDVNNYIPGDTWMNPQLNRIWMLMRDFNVVGGGKQAVWVQLTGGGGGGGIQNLQGDLGAVVGPVGGLCLIDGNHTSGVYTTGNLPNEIQVSVVDATAGVDVAHAQKGVSCFNSADFTVVNGFVSTLGGAGNMSTLSGDNAGVFVPPDGAENTKILGTAAQGISTTGTILSNQVQITASNATAAANVGLVQKGVAGFNSANFTVVNGFVSAIAGAAGIQTVKGNDNVVVGPDGGGNLKILGDTAQGIEIDGVALTNTSTVTAYNANTVGGKGVSTYTASEFNVVAGLVSLTGKNPTLPVFASGKIAQANNITGNGAVYQIIFDQTFINQGPCYNTATGVFTAPVAGCYFFTAGCILDAGVGFALKHVYLEVVPSSGMIIRGTTYEGGTAADNANAGCYANGFIILPALATVVVTVSAIGLAGDTAYMYGNGPGISGITMNNYFHGHLVC